MKMIGKYITIVTGMAFSVFLVSASLATNAEAAGPAHAYVVTASGTCGAYGTCDVTAQCKNSDIVLSGGYRLLGSVSPNFNVLISSPVVNQTFGYRAKIYRNSSTVGPTILSVTAICGQHHTHSGSNTALAF